MEGMDNRSRRGRLRVLGGASLVALAALAVGSCKIAGVDIHDRMESFAVVLNAADRSAINSNFDQSMTQDLPAMNAAFWTTNFPSPPDSDHTYTITLLSYSDPSNVTAQIMGPPLFNSNTGMPRSALFVMSREGLDWFIRQLYMDGSATALIK